MACVERTVEEPGRPSQGAGRPRPFVGRHNCEADPGWGSERPIVAKKRGNARGAKGPYCKHASIEMKGEPLERERSTTENRENRDTLSSEGEAGPKGQTGVRPVNA